MPSLYQWFRERSPDPEKPFLILPDAGTVTYGALEPLSAKAANAMRVLGVGKGDRIAVQTEKAWQALIIYLASLRLGAIYLPLNPGYTPPETEFILKDARPRLFVVDPVRAASLGPIAADIGASVETMAIDGSGSLWPLVESASTSFDDIAIDSDDVASILYTSGTTGRPKGTMLTHRNLQSNAEALVATWRITGSDTLLHALPIFHIHGLYVATNTSLAAGATIIFLSKFDLDAIIRWLPRATTAMGVPTFYARFLSRPEFNRALTAHMRLFVSGSAPLSAETHRAFSARTGHAILERYGMSETGMNTSNPYDGERRPGTVGFPLPGIELRIANPETGEALPDGEVGGIEIRGPNVFKGYWERPDATAKSFRPDGYFITGDLGRIEDGGYVAIVGRDKDLIISGGLNVYPAEVEAVLDAVPGVAESAVIGVPHPDFGEAVVAVVSTKPGAVVEEGAIRTACDGVLAKFKQPKRVAFVEALPRNSMGKIQKTVLRDTYRDLFAGT